MAHPDDEDDPLISESTVELYERARREAKLPAKPEAQAVGALNEMIAALRRAGVLWAKAAEAARHVDARERIEGEADAMAAEVESLCAAVRELGGIPPDRADGREALPFSARDLDYSSDDEAIQNGLDANRAHLAETRRRLAERPGLPGQARAALAKKDS